MTHNLNQKKQRYRYEKTTFKVKTGKGILPKTPLLFHKIVCAKFIFSGQNIKFVTPVTDVSEWLTERVAY